ncbi:MAG TPA: phage tail protein [Candidatus Limnocylindria bacterium]|nr:phage tail protein [Candidatus Limnocylindria bacterium]
MSDRARVSLYELLPGIYRRRDGEETLVASRRLAEAYLEHDDEAHSALAAPPLKALFAILQSQFELIEDDIAALYDDWFVETCRPEMLPLLAEPLAIRDLEALRKGGADLRAIVANIVGYRQAKGTAWALASFAQDATGWTVDVVDGVRSRASTARVDGATAQRAAFVDVRRRARGLTPVAHASTAIDLRHARGGVRTVEVDVWRAGGAHIVGVEPGYPDPSNRRRRTFHPLGADTVIMRATQPPNAWSSGRTSWVPLTRADARSELALRGAIPGIAVRARGWFGEITPPLQVCDLAEWRTPAQASHTVFVDPELGRLVTPADRRGYTVDYGVATYDGNGAEPPSRPWPGRATRTILVGPTAEARELGRARRLEGQILTRLLADAETLRSRRFTLARLFSTFAAEWAFLEQYVERFGDAPGRGRFFEQYPAFTFAPSRAPLPWLIDELARERRADERDEVLGYERVHSFAAALRAAQDAQGSVTIVLGDSQTHRRFFGRWEFRPGPALRELTIESAPGTRPALDGSLLLSAVDQRLEVALRGLTMRGTIACNGNLRLTVERSTLLPPVDRSSLVADAAADPLAILVRRSILGGARLGPNVELTVEDTIVSDALVPPIADGEGCSLKASRATFLAGVQVDQLTASDVLFERPIVVAAPQQGWMRYCVERPGSRAPQRYGGVKTARPLLASTTYGRLGFARLRRDAPAEVRAGGSDGSEIGAYAAYGEARREANLEIALADFVPEGVSARVRYLS